MALHDLGVLHHELAPPPSGRSASSSTRSPAPGHPRPDGAHEAQEPVAARENNKRSEAALPQGEKVCRGLPSRRRGRGRQRCGRPRRGTRARPVELGRRPRANQHGPDRADRDRVAYEATDTIEGVTRPHPGDDLRAGPLVHLRTTPAGRHRRARREVAARNPQAGSGHPPAGEPRLRRQPEGSTSGLHDRGADIAIPRGTATGSTRPRWPTTSWDHCWPVTPRPSTPRA